MNDQYHIRPSGVVHEVFEDEVVIVNLDSGDYYSLLGPGVPLWDCLLAGCTVGEIVGVLRSRYEGSSDEIEASVRTLIGELEGEDLIVSGETGEPSS
ncbi:MAG: PqqD family protein, partial [Rhodothermales bacterium]